MNIIDKITLVLGNYIIRMCKELYFPILIHFENLFFFKLKI